MFLLYFFAFLLFWKRFYFLESIIMKPQTDSYSYNNTIYVLKLFSNKNEHNNTMKYLLGLYSKYYFTNIAFIFFFLPFFTLSLSIVFMLYFGFLKKFLIFLLIFLPNETLPISISWMSKPLCCDLWHLLCHSKFIYTKNRKISDNLVINFWCLIFCLIQNW